VSAFASRATAAPDRRHGHGISAELLIDAVTDIALLMLDSEGRITSWNPGAQRISGWRESEVLGRHFSIFYTPEDIAAGKPERELASVRETGRFEEQAVRLRKDGTRYMANVTVTPLRDETGQIRGFAKVARDITERIAAEEALRAREAHLRSILATVRGLMPRP
jgi:two-component system sensor kinase FixL